MKFSSLFELRIIFVKYAEETNSSATMIFILIFYLNFVTLVTFIYIPFLYTWLIYSLKLGSQDKIFRVQGDFTFPSPSAACLFVGDNTEEGLPRHLVS